MSCQRAVVCSPGAAEGINATADEHFLVADHPDDWADHLERVLTDNGVCYRSKVFAKACRQRSIRHLFTRPYRPRTNGKAERFIQTLLREWAYVRPYKSSNYRNRALLPFVRRYNERRPHGSLGHITPSERLRASL